MATFVNHPCLILERHPDNADPNSRALGSTLHHSKKQIESGRSRSPAKARSGVYCLSIIPWCGTSIKEATTLIPCSLHPVSSIILLRLRLEWLVMNSTADRAENYLPHPHRYETPQSHDLPCFAVVKASRQFDCSFCFFSRTTLMLGRSYLTGLHQPFFDVGLSGKCSA